MQDINNVNRQQWKVTDWNRIITKYIDTGRYYWSDSAGGGNCWIEEKNDRLIFGGYKWYGAAFHASDDFPELQKEAEEDERKHQERLTTLPEWDKTANVVHVTEVMDEDDKIKTTIQETGSYTQRRCPTCGGLTENTKEYAIE